MYKKTPHGLPTASQALTKHRNVLLEVNFSVEFEVFFWGKKVPLFFLGWQKIQGLVVFENRKHINGRV